MNPESTLTTTPTTPACRLCGERANWLGNHIVEVHGMGLEGYLALYPGAPLASEAAIKEMTGRVDRVTKVLPPPVSEVTTDFAGVSTPVNWDVPSDACLPLPKAYRVPQHGHLAQDVQAAVISLACGRSTYIWGEAGSGKDAVIHAWSYYGQRPAKMFQIQPGVDTKAWFFSQAIGANETYWEEGDLLRAVRDGYTTSTGRVLPYLILISDVDRAKQDQMEALRLMLDSIEGRVMGPLGEVYKILPGTQFVFTANTAGGGDASRGRYTSSNVIDASILDRFERVFQFHWMDWKDEEVVVREKFPVLVQRVPWVFEQVGKATAALRAAISKDELYAEFSHRAVCAWLGNVADILTVSKQVPGNLLRVGFRAYADKLSDEETRQAAEKLIDAHIKGGALDVGAGATTGTAPASGRMR